MTKQIYVTFTQEGYHCWPSPEAPPHLQAKHRHLFHFKVEAKVTGSDREIEFHKLLDIAKQTLWMEYARHGAHSLWFADSSCETIAEALLKSLRHQVPQVYSVEVSEDGECGAKVSI